MRSLTALKVLCVLFVFVALAACATAPPAPAPVPAATTEAPAATTAAPAPAPAQATVKDPVPYPDPPVLEVGGAEVKRLPIDQIVTYKALPEYHQAPFLDKLVSEGKLPPVKDRLPERRVPRVPMDS